MQFDPSDTAFLSGQLQHFWPLRLPEGEFPKATRAARFQPFKAAPPHTCVSCLPAPRTCAFCLHSHVSQRLPLLALHPGESGTPSSLEMSRRLPKVSLDGPSPTGRPWTPASAGRLLMAEEVGIVATDCSPPTDPSRPQVYRLAELRYRRRRTSLELEYETSWGSK